MNFEQFHYAGLDDVRAKAKELDAFLPLSEDLSCLRALIDIHGHTAFNRIALSPMEGTDGTETGSPGPLTARRYRRFAEGGAGLIWFEAVSNSFEGRASVHQLWLREDNLSDFQRLVEETKEAGLRKNGYAPVLVMQATHSGRYAKPRGVPEPMIAYNNPVLEGDTPIDETRILTDDQISEIAASYERAARLARAAGFDGVDIKCCHRYLACELLSAYTRPGRYGGSFENRTRFLREALEAARSAVSNDFFLTSRVNVYDGFPYPYGFGVTEESGLEPVLDEGRALARMLKEKFDMPLLNVTIGNPYKNPHVNRPYDRGNYVPDEHPLAGVSRMMRCVSEIQSAVPDMPVIGSAFSYLRAFSGNLASGMVGGGHAALAGFGREAFAYPEFANDLLRKGALDPNRVCVSCGACAVLLRHGSPAGCVVRDREFYKPYKEGE